MTNTKTGQCIGLMCMYVLLRQFNIVVLVLYPIYHDNIDSVVLACSVVVLTCSVDVWC